MSCIHVTIQYFPMTFLLLLNFGKHMTKWMSTPSLNIYLHVYIPTYKYMMYVQVWTCIYMFIYTYHSVKAHSSANQIAILCILINCYTIKKSGKMQQYSLLIISQGCFKISQKSLWKNQHNNIIIFHVWKESLYKKGARCIATFHSFFKINFIGNVLKTLI